MTRRWWWCGLSRAAMLLFFGTIQGCGYDTSRFRGGTITEGRKGDHFRYMAELRDFDASVPGKTTWHLIGMPAGPFAILLEGDCQSLDLLGADHDRKVTLRFARKDWRAAETTGGRLSSDLWTRGRGFPSRDACSLSPTEWQRRPMESQGGHHFDLQVEIEGHPLPQGARLKPKLIWAKPFYAL